MSSESAEVPESLTRKAIKAERNNEIAEISDVPSFTQILDPAPVKQEKVVYFNLDEVKQDVRKDIGSWLQLKSSEDLLVLGYYDHESGELSKRLLIKDDLTVTANFGEVQVRKTWSLQEQSITEYLQMMDNMKKCTGICEPSLEEVTCSKIYSYVKSSLLDGMLVSQTFFRSKSCEGAVEGEGMCKECSIYSYLGLGKTFQ